MSGEEFCDEPQDGSGPRMAFVLFHWPKQKIERHLLRSLLPVGKIVEAPKLGKISHTSGGHKKRSSRNVTTDKYKQLLRRWEEAGLIKRDEQWVYICNREGFRRLANRLVVDKSSWLIEVVLQYKSAPVAREMRRQELLTLRNLMEDREVHHGSGRGAVRLVPRGRSL